MRYVHLICAVALAVAAVSVLGCGSPVACTANYVFGLTIYVTDSATNTPLVDEQTTVTVRDGDYAETARSFGLGFGYHAAGERAGVYSISIERPGYQSWTQSNVPVRGGECHVSGVIINAGLQRTS